METNNRLREAIYAVYNSLCDHEIIYPKARWRLIEMIDAALIGQPMRNYEVGTPREQNERYNKFCHAHLTPENGCGGCPLNGEPCCELAWAQMPYVEKEGDNK